MTAVGLAVNPATGGYWVLRSDGKVDNFNAPALGSMAGSLPAGVRVTGIAAGKGGGYYVLTSDGGVHNFGRRPGTARCAASFRRRDGGGARHGRRDRGYWVLKSNGGVNNFSAPWYGSLAGKLASSHGVTGITGQ